MKWQRTSGPGDTEAVYAEQEAHSRRVLAGAGFPVFGWVHEDWAVPGRDVLAAYEVRDGELEAVETRSGDWSSPQGPYVTVRTHRPGAEAGTPLPDLEDVVEDERDRVYEQLGVDEGDTAGRVRALRGWITVDGEPHALQVHEDSRTPAGHGTVWAGRLRVGGTTVTVTGRGVLPGAVELRGIADFERYIVGRTAMLRQVAALRADRRPAEPDPEPAELGLRAHRELVLQAIARAAAVVAQLRAGRSARLPRHLRGEERRTRWESAVRQQMRLASETREEADEAVTSMVNHLSRLAHHADWVSGTAEGTAAVEEVVRYTAFASEVPSLPAQRAWERLWAGGTPELPSGTEDAWLTAWEQWRVERTQHGTRR
ncbi:MULTISPECIES: hypothetical protein [Kitasatospora]|uniref:Uncharacterized protein n=1 Tax=Kitasatospora setae (strain ATCC 33774 / DSM 43861 / JCM 3304 / KCC A-0304 / NBRC 14216 / KM-6054) TaxID=452652 RepID=E4N018_KITSK|nr:MULTISPECIES: hypothetical protein [Kitasatospora]BAJ31346.1 hypothetical protein KSE_55710 [Kitasatospora setae KM-6054]